MIKIMTKEIRVLLWRLTMNKISKYFLFVFCGFYISVAQAGNYLLTMSKDDKACQHLYQLFNWDLRKKGKLALDEHEEFNWLKWEKDFFMIQLHGNKEPNFDDELIGKEGHLKKYDSYTKYPKKGAFFDVDNNGEDDFITFERRGGETFENRAYDNLAIYKGNSLEKLSQSEITKQSSPKMGYLGGLTSNYVLKAYPIKRTSVYKTGAISHRWPNLSDSYIKPLLLNKTYYIALFGNVDTRGNHPQQAIDEKNAIAVVKFTPSYDAVKIKNQSNLLGMGQPSNETQDICYFVKTQVIQQGQK